MFGFIQGFGLTFVSSKNFWLAFSSVYIITECHWTAQTDWNQDNSSQQWHKKTQTFYIFQITFRDMFRQNDLKFANEIFCHYVNIRYIKYQNKLTKISTRILCIYIPYLYTIIWNLSIKLSCFRAWTSRSAADTFSETLELYFLRLDLMSSGQNYFIVYVLKSYFMIRQAKCQG